MASGQESWGHRAKMANLKLVTFLRQAAEGDYRWDREGKHRGRGGNLTEATCLLGDICIFISYKALFHHAGCSRALTHKHI